ncbi:MAG: hypothetical protein MJK15_05085 [Colwellia sp.]|nr:hypothetical protein [Colwellia sp.]
MVIIDAKTDRVDAKLKATDKKLNRLDSSVTKVDKDFKRMAATMVTGALAAAAAVGILVNSTVTFARELEVAARRTGETVEGMQAWAFASQTVGISLEKLGDIGKDTNEKIGEFLATGGGGFVDFIDVMKITNAEGRELAKTFSTMAGTDVLQEMVKQMEAAGVSSNQMSFALEGLASDATDLIPLLSGNAAELKKLKTNFEEVGSVLSQGDIDKIKEVGIAFNQLGHSFSAGGRQMIADYSEELILAVEVITTLGIRSSELFDIIATGWGNIVELGSAALDDFVNGTDTFGSVLEERTRLSSEAIEKFASDSTTTLEIIVKKGTKIVKKGTQDEKRSYKDRLDQFSKYTKAASIIQGAFFEENKALQAGIIVADTAASVMKSLSINPYDYANVAVLIATGAAQLSNALSSSPGGGSVSGASGGGVSSEPAQQDFQEQTSSLSLTDSEASGSQTLNITVPDGDEIGQAIANWLNQATAEGRN